MPTPAGWTPVADTSAWKPVSEPSAVARFGTGLYNSTIGPIAETIKNPGPAVEGTLETLIGTKELKAIANAVHKGDYSMAAKLAVLHVLQTPQQRLGDAMVAPMAEDASKGDYAGAAGRLVGTSAMLAAPIAGESAGLKLPSPTVADTIDALHVARDAYHVATSSNPITKVMAAKRLLQRIGSADAPAEAAPTAPVAAEQPPPVRPPMAQAPQVPAAAPPPSVAPVEAPPAPQVVPPAPAEAVAARSPAEMMRDELLNNGTIGKEHLSVPEAAPDTVGPAIEITARAAKASKLAELFSKSNVSSRALADWTPAHWDGVTKDIGMPKFSKTSQGEVIQMLRKLEKTVPK